DEVADDAQNFSCIRDNVTGLVWEVKSPVSGVVPNTTLRDGQNLYTWYLTESAIPQVGGARGAANSSCPSNTDCGLQSYIQEVNALDFCGGTNWRVPTYTELLSLVDYGKQGQNVLIDESIFPNMPAVSLLGHLRYWTSQTAVDGTSLSQAYIIDMSDGNDLAYPKSKTAYVRLVRSR
ncbi:Lcl C-terminal domain-containing protein, partial [Pseudoalteromonas nigrifaciens]